MADINGLVLMAGSTPTVKYTITYAKSHPSNSQMKYNFSISCALGSSGAYILSGYAFRMGRMDCTDSRNHYGNIRERGGFAVDYSRQLPPFPDSDSRCSWRKLLFQLDNILQFCAKKYPCNTSADLYGNSGNLYRESGNCGMVGRFARYRSDQTICCSAIHFRR